MSSDLELLQGTWNVTALEMDGQTMPSAVLANARIVIEGNRFTSIGVGAEYQGTLTLDASASPRRLDLKFETGPEKGNTNLGIYEIDGDTWKLCLATRGNVRPAEFASKPGSGVAVETLERAGTAARSRKAHASAKTGAASPGTEFEGEWLMVSCTIDGQPMHESLVKWVKRVTQGNRSTVYAGPQVMLRVEFTSDDSTRPPHIEYVNLVGSNRGKAQLGIYEFAGGMLKICVGPPEAARPAEFRSVAGDGRTLSVWKRA
jgi:uncharacterized protein (TIGR03067 family)